jgi:hypothetical protein
VKATPTAPVADTSSRKAYSTPKLVTYGNVATVTQNNGLHCGWYHLRGCGQGHKS